MEKKEKRWAIEEEGWEEVEKEEKEEWEVKKKSKVGN